MIAILCASRNSIYKTLEDVDVYDIDRDARGFVGGCPVVAHPPCRAWSAFCAHQAKPAQGEKDLGMWCCEMLKQCGGVLEQPAHSRLFKAGGLPRPKDGRVGDLWSIYVEQAWWGFPFKKGTWLCFCGVDPSSVVVPFVLRDPRGDRQRWNTKSKNQRAATCESFARWLVDVARTV